MLTANSTFAALSKRNNLQIDVNSNLIIDITTYLGQVEKDMELLKDLQTKSDKEKKIDFKLKVINKTRDAYESEINASIEDGKEIIEKQLQPKLDEFQEQVDAQLEKLVIEIQQLKKTAKEKIEEQEKKKEELRKAMYRNLGVGGCLIRSDQSLIKVTFFIISIDKPFSF